MDNHTSTTFCNEINKIGMDDASITRTLHPHEFKRKSAAKSWRKGDKYYYNILL
jgi:hypothetical protein